ncbi:MAG: AAA family ATPase, partial [Oscillospiraceae bacterium]|nr:AAA family ATPase [Oscillospiraceae bacterium]
YRELPTFEFGSVTIFCGGNGSGKSTILNVIAECLHLRRGAVYNRSEAFEDYISLCGYKLCPGTVIPPESRIITSDDVFDYLLDIRYINSGIDKKRNELFDTYFEKRSVGSEEARLRSLDDYDRWREIADAKRSKRPDPTSFVRDRGMQNVRERSNGESALYYFTEEIKEDALYLLDEPENSLSAEFQLELKSFLEASVRAYNCQFIISTHSPFLLSMQGAEIYDLDTTPPRKRPWTEIKNVRVYHDFFAEHQKDF